MRKLKINESSVAYVYDSQENIKAVQIPYNTYLDLINEKRNRVLKNTVSEESVGYGILQSSLQELRTQGMSLVEIARGLDVSQPYISNLLNGNTKPTKETLNKYLKKIDRLAKKSVSKK